MGKLHNISGRCLCGAVGYNINVPKLDVDICHCAMCRRWSGPFFALPYDGPITFSGRDHIAVYKSSEWAERGFCKICGTSLYWHLSGSDHYALSAGTLDDEQGLKLTSQIFIDEKPAFYDFANVTAKLKGAQAVAAFQAGQDNP